MGHIRHRTVIATVPMWLGGKKMGRVPGGVPGTEIPGLLEIFRAELPERFQRLLQGPILSDANGINTWFFSTAASKGGWEEDNEVREWQEKFIAIFERPSAGEKGGGSVCSVLVVQWPEFAGLGEPTAVRRV